MPSYLKNKKNYALQEFLFLLFFINDNFCSHHLFDKCGCKNKGLCEDIIVKIFVFHLFSVYKTIQRVIWQVIKTSCDGLLPPELDYIFPIILESIGVTPDTNNMNYIVKYDRKGIFLNYAKNIPLSFVNQFFEISTLPWSAFFLSDKKIDSFSINNFAKLAFAKKDMEKIGLIKSYGYNYSKKNLISCIPSYSFFRFIFLDTPENLRNKWSNILINHAVITQNFPIIKLISEYGKPDFNFRKGKKGTVLLGHILKWEKSGPEIISAFDFFLSSGSNPYKIQKLGKQLYLMDPIVAGGIIITMTKYGFKVNENDIIFLIKKNAFYILTFIDRQTDFWVRLTNKMPILPYKSDEMENVLSYLCRYTVM